LAFNSFLGFELKKLGALVATRSHGWTVGADELVPGVEVGLEVGHRFVVMHVVFGCSAIDAQREPVMGRPGEVKS